MNKQDFLKAICGGSFDHQIGEDIVRIKGLSVKDMREVSELSADDPLKAGLLTVVFGMVDPKLSIEDLEALGEGSASYIGSLAEAIAKLSGIVGESESPLAGNGSE